jgi:2-oxoglutarate ferredoxin oxidoreductase subunit gamma
MEIRLAGSGGQGLQLAARILAEALAGQGRTVAQSQSYEPTSRGGMSRADLVVGDATADYPLVTALDCLVVLDNVAAGASDALVRPGALVLADDERAPDQPSGAFRLERLPFAVHARGAGSERVANMVALGALVALSGVCPRPALEAVVRAETPPKFLDLNLEALAAGFALAEALPAAAE